MPKLVKVPTFSDDRGHLSVLESIIPFVIKRVFYIYGVNDSIRGNHRHHKTVQALICISGNCIISNDNGLVQHKFVLDSPDKCLILFPEDYHSMHNFSSDAILLVLASELFNPSDYIYESYS
jgi:dTDP-4-dehydrorhamnose 3,5-epimerase-like enzyme